MRLQLTGICQLARGQKANMGGVELLAPTSRSRFQIGLIIATGVATALSLIGGPRLGDSVLLHAPTLATLVLLAFFARKRLLSDPSMVAILAFVWLHILAARYTYSHVPYDEWSRAMFGRSVSEAFGFERNHSDRLAHFLYGVLLTPAQVEVLRGRFRLGRLTAHVLSFTLILAAGALYEVAEWFVALLFAGDLADRYNGQQGDIWDAQKDMGLAALGAILATLVAYALPEQVHLAWKARLASTASRRPSSQARYARSSSA